MRWCLILLVLAACNTVPPRWSGVPVHTVTIDESTFEIRHRDPEVHVLRINSEWMPDMRTTSMKAARAIKQATGCPLAQGSLTGDPVMMTGLVSCGDGSVLRRYLEALAMEALMAYGQHR